MNSPNAATENAADIEDTITRIRWPIETSSLDETRCSKHPHRPGTDNRPEHQWLAIRPTNSTSN